MNGSEHVSVSLTLEDEFVLTRIKNDAHGLKGKDRDQYLWNKIVRLICRERAYKYVVDELGVCVDPNIEVFDDSENEKN
jgi:hypothetical protein